MNQQKSNTFISGHIRTPADGKGTVVTLPEVRLEGGGCHGLDCLFLNGSCHILKTGKGTGQIGFSPDNTKALAPALTVCPAGNIFAVPGTIICNNGCRPKMHLYLRKV